MHLVLPTTFKTDLSLLAMRSTIAERYSSILDTIDSSTDSSARLKLFWSPWVSGR